jgi:hypothetical protein
MKCSGIQFWHILMACLCFTLPADFALAQGGTAAKPAAGPKLETFDAKAFDKPTAIDNKWFPMKPGTRWVLEGTTVEDDGKVVPHKVELTITNLTKMVGGIRAVVSYDIDYTENELVETKLAFYAQDNTGTIWYLGSHAEEFEDGKLTKSRTWLHGVERAQAGILMKAAPQAGAPSYSQGYGPDAEWTHRGQVMQVGQTTTTRAGKYADVIVIKEAATENADPHTLKYYASGTGYVRLGAGGKKGHPKETMQLTKVEQLSPKALAQVHENAMKLEKSAYQVSKNVYGRSAPMTLNK